MTHAAREVDLNVVARQLVGEMLDDLDKLKDAKWRFAEVTRAYREQFPGDFDTADLAASSDYRRKQAIADCAWFQAEIQTSALAVCALVLWGNGGVS